MRFSILTLFPDVIEQYTQTSIVGRARQGEIIDVRIVNPRDFTQNIHKKVDDSPYGGGAGMVMTLQPLDDAFQSICPLKPRHRIFLTTPAGPTFNHPMAQGFAQDLDEIVILCGHYEGIDERIFSIIPNLEPLSVGDFVLTGGELAALTVIDAVTRLIPGAVQKFESVENDSFYEGLLDYPHYTRPAEYKGHTVPEILLSGDHQKIAQWRHQQALDKTKRIRPDLLPHSGV